MSNFVIFADRGAHAVEAIQSRIDRLGVEIQGYSELLHANDITPVQRVRCHSRIRCNEQTIARLTTLLQLAQEA